VKFDKTVRRFGEGSVLTIDGQVVGIVYKRLLLNPGKGVPTPRRCSEYRELPSQASDQVHTHGHDH